MGAETSRPEDMSKIKIETMPWPEWAKSLGLVEAEADEKMRKKAHLHICIRVGSMFLLHVRHLAII